MTKEQLDNLAEIARTATPGPWHIDDYGDVMSDETGDEVQLRDGNNLEFIVAFRNAAVELVESARELRKHE